MMWQFNYLSMLIKSLASLAMLFAVTAHAQFVVMDVRGAPVYLPLVLMARP
jgi:hypothetical protein